MKELEELVKDPPEDIRVVINDSDVTDIQAFIDGPGKLNVHIITHQLPNTL